MKKTVYCIFACIILLSCNAYKDIPVHKLELGMDKNQVQSIVKKKMVKVSASKTNDGNREIYQVQKRIVRGGIARQQRFNLIFLNGELIEYEKDSEKFSF